MPASFSQLLLLLLLTLRQPQPVDAEGFCDDTNCGPGTREVLYIDEACVCDCRNQWSGLTCEDCPAMYDKGKDCGECADEEAVGYPECTQCRSFIHCSGHADHVAPSSDRKSCVCTCAGKWEPPTCETCPEQYDATTCAACAKGYSGVFPDCQLCTSDLKCNGRAVSVTVVPPNCVCTDCRAHWEGEACEECPEEWDALRDCDVCADGYTDNKQGGCRECKLQTDCRGRGISVGSSDDRTRCVCVCNAAYSGDDCGVCADGFYEPPSGTGCVPCDKSLCIADHTVSIATEGNACVCKCKMGYKGAKCESCKPGYYMDNGCVECTSAMCSDREDSVTSNADNTGCVCDCRHNWGGDDCSTCSSPYGGNDCDSCDFEHINPPYCNKKCTIASACNGLAVSVEADPSRHKCLCTCQEGFEGDACERCAEGYTGTPPSCTKCKMDTCEPGHALDVSSDDARSKCTCVCYDNYEEPFCDTCQEGYIGYPDCKKCTNEKDCNGRAKCSNKNRGKVGCNGVDSNQEKTSCTCDCRNSYSGDSCQTCPPRYEGDCDKCVEGRIQYPACVLCTSDGHCNGHAEDVSSDDDRLNCICICSDPYEGDDCNKCADGYINYPTCEACDSAKHCNGRAKGVSSDDSRTTCVCDCKEGFSGDACEKCAEGYIGKPPACVKCTSEDHCYGRAETVTDDGTRSKCVCDCRNYWMEEDSCQTCNSTYKGSDCDACSNSTGILPTCNQCGVDEHCNGRAKAVQPDSTSPTGCHCDCINSWEGASCHICPEKYDPSKNCGACKTGIQYPECRECDLAQDCTGHAAEVFPDETGTRCVCKGTYWNWCDKWEEPCTCTDPSDENSCPCGVIGCKFWGSCNNMWSGRDCSVCPSKYAGVDCDRCADGFVRYPRCYQCDDGNYDTWRKWGCDPVRTSAVVADPKQENCVCQCMYNYEDPPSCGRCSYGYINYPQCEECNVWHHCNGNADSVGCDYNRTECICNCKVGYETDPSLPGQCNTCAEGHFGYDTGCQQCTVAKHCSGNALNVTDNGMRTGCSCDCYGSWTGDSCETCPEKYGGRDCSRCKEGRIVYPHCFECTQDNCNSHAVSITTDAAQLACVCQCRNGWGGAHGTCYECPAPYANPADKPDADCNYCENPSATYPNCGVTCTVSRDCSNHAFSVTDEGGSCSCRCRHHWTGPRCETCPPEYGGVDCDSCGRDYHETSSGTCALCTNAGFCNGRACGFDGCVRATASGCACTGCAAPWTGPHCDVCPSKFAGVNCDRCSDGRHDYPICSECDASQCQDGRAVGMGTDVHGNCFCRCDPRFSGRHCDGGCSGKWRGAACDECPPLYGGENCDRCAEGRAGYPECGLCTVEHHCFGRAERATGDGVYCECHCYADHCGNYGSCRVSGSGLPTPEPTLYPPEEPSRKPAEADASGTETLTLTLTLTDPTTTATATPTIMCGLGFGYARTRTPTLTPTLLEENEEAAAEEDKSSSAGVIIIAVLVGLGCCCILLALLLFLRKRKQRDDGQKDFCMGPNGSNSAMIPLKSVGARARDEEVALFFEGEGVKEGTVNTACDLGVDDVSIGSEGRGASEASLGNAEQDNRDDSLEDRCDV